MALKRIPSAVWLPKGRDELQPQRSHRLRRKLVFRPAETQNYRATPSTSKPPVEQLKTDCTCLLQLYTHNACTPSYIYRSKVLADDDHSTSLCLCMHYTQTIAGARCRKPTWERRSSHTRTQIDAVSFHFQQELWRLRETPTPGQHQCRTLSAAAPGASSNSCSEDAAGGGGVWPPPRHSLYIYERHATAPKPAARSHASIMSRAFHCPNSSYAAIFISAWRPLLLCAFSGAQNR